MGSTAGLSVNTFDVDNAKGISWHDTALVEREAVLALRLGLVHEAFGDVMRRVDQSVCCILNLILLLPCQALKMRDIQMRLLLSLLCASLPDMWTKDLSAGGKNEMRSRVMGLKLPSSCEINRTVDSLSNDAILRQLLVDLVQNTFTDFKHIDDVENHIEAFNCHRTNIVGLTT